MSHCAPAQRRTQSTAGLMSGHMSHIPVYSGHQHPACTVPVHGTYPPEVLYQNDKKIKGNQANSDSLEKWLTTQKKENAPDEATLSTGNYSTNKKQLFMPFIHDFS